ncbi:MAG: radical SAM protein [Candidatus Riflebacteria bacterium]|nr:radical SAM protein [Candidatus Riflebacteria bacterium]
MIKVLLVQVARAGRSGEVERPSRMWFHGVTLPYLAALFSHRAEVEIVDELSRPVPFDHECDLVGITFMGAALPRALEVADRFRARGRRVVVGGVTAAGYADDVAGHVDAQVIGDAEGLIDPLLDDLEAGRLRRIYRHETPLEDLSSAPLPRYDLVDPRRVGPYFPVEATRGCSIGCSFCLSSHVHGRAQRRRPVALVERDVRWLADRGRRRILFVDDNPMLDRRYFTEVLEAIGPIGVTFTANATADVLTDGPFLDRLAAAGCESLSLGFETLDPANLAAIGKGYLDPSTYPAGLAGLRDRGIQALGMFVVGLDTDGPDVFDRIERFLLENRVEMAFFHILTPVRGAPLHDELAGQGRLLGLHATEHGGDRAVFRPARMTPEELEAGFWRLQERFYSIRSILTRLVLVRPDRHYLRRLPTVLANLYFGWLARRRRIVI